MNPNELVKNWFDDEFNHLHPLLQQLHINGGKLAGDVDISYGKGLAGIIGARLAKKMNLPNKGVHQLVVSISHDSEGLHWSRRFNEGTLVESVFKPVGNIQQGYWVEITGPLTMKLTVDIINGGWYWRCLKINFLGLPIPLWLTPKANAYKMIENGQYRFYVEFSLPVIGSLVCYQGLLYSESS
jgi:hypothetical protein